MGRSAWLMAVLAVLVVTVEARVLHSMNKTDSDMYWGIDDEISNSDYTPRVPSDTEWWN